MEAADRKELTAAGSLGRPENDNAPYEKSVQTIEQSPAYEWPLFSLSVVLNSVPSANCTLSHDLRRASRN
jgi:hypothetical protein